MPEARMGPSGEPIVLTMAAVRLDLPWIREGEYVYTRAYNGGIPGPTIRVKPGENLTVRLVNDLDFSEPDCPQDRLGIRTGNSSSWHLYAPVDSCLLNTTNLHPHGLHVSPFGNADNIFMVVEPGVWEASTYQIPADHMGGTHMYHPHHHHSTASQAGGGAAGVLIVDDPPDSLPPQVQNLPEIVLLLLYVDFKSQLRLESDGGGALWKPALGSDLGAAAPVLLTNGQREPVMHMAPKQWYRLRMVFASLVDALLLSHAASEAQQGGLTCEWQLLAKDGVYLEIAPRPIHVVFLATANRADVAMRCWCAHDASDCEGDVHWQALGISDNAEELPQAGPNGTAWRVRVSPQEEAALAPRQRFSGPLPRFQVKHPCYLANLLGVQVNASNKAVLSQGADRITDMFDEDVSRTLFSMRWNGHGEAMLSSDPKAAPNDLATLRLGEVYEVDVSAAAYHPMHTHVMAYQIVNGSPLNGSPLNGDYLGSWFEDGDWHDTLLTAQPRSIWNTTIRFQTDRFRGRYMIHCHNLLHEDAGMMGWIVVEGKEGTVWAGAEQADPTCYHANNPRPGYRLA